MWLTLFSFIKNQMSVLDYILVGCIVALLGWATSLKIENCSLTADVKSQAETIAKNNVDIRDLQTSLAKKRSEINLQNKLIEQNKIDKEAKDKEVKTQKEEIDKKYKLKREEIQRYKGDENASSCDNARMFFNSAYW